MAELRLHGTYDLLNYARTQGAKLQDVAAALSLPMIYLQGAGRRAGFVRFYNQAQVNAVITALGAADEDAIKDNAGFRVL